MLGNISLQNLHVIRCTECLLTSDSLIRSLDLKSTYKKKGVFESMKTRHTEKACVLFFYMWSSECSLFYDV